MQVQSSLVKILQNFKVCNYFPLDWCFAFISTLGRSQVSKMPWFPMSLHSVADYSTKTLFIFQNHGNLRKCNLEFAHSFCARIFYQREHFGENGLVLKAVNYRNKYLYHRCRQGPLIHFCSTFIFINTQFDLLRNVRHFFPDETDELHLANTIK